MTTVLNLARPGPAIVEARRGAWRRISSAVGTLATVLAVVVACVAVVLAVATHLAPRGEYRAFGHPVMIMTSGSMTPVIRTGDLVVDRTVSPAAARHLRVGQIVSVREVPGSDVVVTHRIVAVVTSQDRIFYVTRGDANNAPDAVLRPAGDVVGVVEFTIPRGGYVLEALHRPVVLGLIVAALLLGFLAGPLFRLARRLDEDAPAGSGGPS